MVSTSTSLTLEVPTDDSFQPSQNSKKPRKVLHFSDGVLEEYSTDEEDGSEQNPDKEAAQQLSHIDPSTLEWVPWLWYQSVVAGTKTLEVCDYLGEGLASFFGITTPKYQFEIDHYQQQLAEEEALKKEHDLEMGGWVTKTEENAAESNIAVTEPKRY